MTTETISISEWKKNITPLTNRANQKHIRFIITSHGRPIGEYRPIQTDERETQTKYSQDFIDELAEMEREYEAGDFSGPFHSTKDLFAHLDSLPYITH